jgi:hypothetical protein
MDICPKSTHNLPMPTIRLTDGFGLDVDVSPDPLSSLGRYIRDPGQLRALVASNAAIDTLPFEKLELGLRFETPVQLGREGADLSIGAGLGGAIGVFVPKEGDQALFPGDEFGEETIVPLDQAYVSVGLRASVDAGAGVDVSRLTFGLEAGKEILITTHKRFATKPAPPGLGAALAGAIRDFTIPGDAKDLARMKEGAIATVEGRGSLRFSGTANLLAAVNPLAGVEVPVAGEIGVRSGATISVGASFEVAGEYQVRVTRGSQDRVQVGYYKKRGTEFTVSAGAKAGAGATLRDRDVLALVLGAIRRQPSETGELAGLSEDQIAALAKIVKTAVDRRLEAAASFELGSLSSKEAAFLFDVELARLDEAGHRALERALGGDLTMLADEEALPAGFQLRRSILRRVNERRHAFRVNLLGIFNAISFGQFLLESTATFDPAIGLTLVDRATATRVGAVIANLDSAKLRKLLADFFLITAVYRGGKLAVGAPELECSHTYFELQGRTRSQAMKDNLDVAEALGLLAPARKRELLAGVADFGRTAFLAETAYDPALCRRLFLDGDRVRTEEEYDRAGLDALAALVQPGDPDAYRRAPALDATLWSRMKAAGQFNFAPLFPQLGEVQRAVVASDYTVIRWWSRAMHEAASILAEVEALPSRDPSEARFQALRARLASHLASVAAHTTPHWGDPWGLVAMDRVVGGAARARVEITGPRLALAESRQIAGSAAGV